MLVCPRWQLFFLLFPSAVLKVVDAFCDDRLGLETRLEIRSDRSWRGDCDWGGVRGIVQMDSGYGDEMGNLVLQGNGGEEWIVRFYDGFCGFLLVDGAV